MANQVELKSAEAEHDAKATCENVPQNGATTINETIVKQASVPVCAKKRKRNASSHSNESTVKRKKIFKYGNYDRYYGYRNINETPKEDIRLQAFIEQKELITGKRLLDIGCNNGSLTLLIAKHCHPASVVGIDIDGDLIGSARRHQTTMLKSCIDDGDALRSLKCVEFKTANYAYKDESLLANEKAQFDVILCLSVTKWIHLNFGDAAVKLCFKRVYRQLHDGGIFILEAQPWGSYKKKKRLTGEIFANYKKISFRPSDFNRFLLGDEIGFREMFELKLADHTVKGFRRPIYVFRK